MNPKVDTYLMDGCGRCSLYQTPDCKVHQWAAILKQLRRIVLDCGLNEAFKWSQPCYTYKNSNVLIVTAFKDYACISFFKGALLQDTHKALVIPGENSQAARQLRFTNVESVIKMETIIKNYIYEVIEVEKAGLKVQFKKQPEPIPEELLAIFEERPDVEEAFKALTPGRQRGYIIHFSQPKQSKTKMARIEKCIPKILNGEGFHDGYRARKK